MLPTPDRRGRAWAFPPTVALVLLAAFAGCGSASTQRLDVADANSLQQTLASVRSSAQRGDRSAVLAELAAMRARITRLSESGALPAAEAAALRTGLAHALAAARRELAPPAAVVPVTVPPAPVKHRKEHHAEGDHRSGKHRDHGGGHGGPEGGGGD